MLGLLKLLESLKLLKSLKSWLEDIIGIGNSSKQINIFNNIDSCSSSTLNISALEFNRDFLAGFLEAIGEVSN